MFRCFFPTTYTVVRSFQCYVRTYCLYHSSQWRIHNGLKARLCIVAAFVVELLDALLKTQAHALRFGGLLKHGCYRCWMCSSCWELFSRQRCNREDFNVARVSVFTKRVLKCPACGCSPVVPIAIDCYQSSLQLRSADNKP